MAEIFIVQNVSTNEIEIKDFGILLSAAASIELENFDKAVLSDEVLNYINNGDLVRLIDGSIVPSNKVFSFANQLYPDLLLESSLGFGVIFDSSSSQFVVNSSEFTTVTQFDASINAIVTLSVSEFLNESSLGPQFYFLDGSLFVIDISGGSGDVTLAYVDGSLAARDVSIANIEASLGDYVRKDGDTMSGKLSFSHDSSGDIAGNISGGQHGTLNLDSSLGIILNSPYLAIPEASSYVGDFLTIGTDGILNYTSLNQPTSIWTDVISAPFNIPTTLETSILSITIDQDVSYGSSFYYTELDLPWWRDIWFRIYKNGLLFLEELFTGGPGLTTFSDSNSIQDEGISSGSILEITVQSNIANYSVEAGEAIITKYGNNVTAEWGSITGDINNQTDLQAQRTADRIYVDGSLNNKADLSYVNQTFLRESSLGADFVWNTGLLDVSIDSVSQAYVDGSLSARDISINNNSNLILINDASIIRIDNYNSIQDASILNLEASLGNYVLKSGDTMTGPLNTTALNITGDVSVIGSFYLGDTSDGGVNISTDLLAVVTESGKIVATSIPASNVDTTVIDISIDTDVSILRGFYYVDTTAGNVTLTIPDASTENDGKLFSILKKSSDLNSVIVTTQGGIQNIGTVPIQTINQQDKGFTIVSDNDNNKWLITQDSRYLEGNTQGEFQYWDVSTRAWKPTTSDITWDNQNLKFVVGGNSVPSTFEVDASNDIVYINAQDISGLVPADNLGFYAGGRGAFGNEVTIDRLRNNVPGNVPRALSLIDTHAVLRVWRFVNDANDPGVEFVWGTQDAPSDPLNNWWDMFVDGSSTGLDSFSIRSRTAPFGNLKLLTVFRDHTQIESTTESYDSSSGSFQTFGGAGISGNLYAKGAINPGGSENVTTFPDSSTGGDMFFRQDLNQMFLYDAIRGKWLSMDRATYTAGSNRITSSTTGYMDVGRGTMSSATGYRMPKNGTILGATIQNRSNVTIIRDMSIRINDVSAYSITVPISNPGGITGNNGNADFVKDDLIQIVLENGGSTMRDIQASFEVAWRE